MIDLIKNESGRKIVKEFVALRAETENYLTDNNNKDKKVKGAKKCVLKKQLNLKIKNTV